MIKTKQFSSFFFSLLLLFLWGGSFLTQAQQFEIPDREYQIRRTERQDARAVFKRTPQGWEFLTILKEIHLTAFRKKYGPNKKGVSRKSVVQKRNLDGFFKESVDNLKGRRFIAEVFVGEGDEVNRISFESRDGLITQLNFTADIFDTKKRIQRRPLTRQKQKDSDLIVREELEQEQQLEPAFFFPPGSQPPEGRTLPPPVDEIIPPRDRKPPTDRREPPEDRVPPTDRREPPEGRVPPTTRTVPPTTKTVPPTTRTVPPTTKTVPPTTRTVPPTTRTGPPPTTKTGPPPTTRTGPPPTTKTGPPPTTRTGPPPTTKTGPPPTTRTGPPPTTKTGPPPTTRTKRKPVTTYPGKRIQPEPEDKEPVPVTTTTGTPEDGRRWEDLTIDEIYEKAGIPLPEEKIEDEKKVGIGGPPTGGPTNLGDPTRGVQETVKSWFGFESPQQDDEVQKLVDQFGQSPIDVGDDRVASKTDFIDEGSALYEVNQDFKEGQYIAGFIPRDGFIYPPGKPVSGFVSRDGEVVYQVGTPSITLSDTLQKDIGGGAPSLDRNVKIEHGGVIFPDLPGQGKVFEPRTTINFDVSQTIQETNNFRIVPSANLVVRFSDKVVPQNDVFIYGLAIGKREDNGELVPDVLIPVAFWEDQNSNKLTSISVINDLEQTRTVADRFPAVTVFLVDNVRNLLFGGSRQFTIAADNGAVIGEETTTRIEQRKLSVPIAGDSGTLDTTINGNNQQLRTIPFKIEINTGKFSPNSNNSNNNNNR